MVIEFSEKPQSFQRYINGGFFVFNRQFFNYLSKDDSCILEKEPLERLSKAGELMVYHHTGIWYCMDTYRDYKFLQELWEKGNAHWRIWE